MKFQLSVSLDNAAFDDDATELARILADLAERILRMGDVELGDSGPLRDVNGNSVGLWSVDES